MRINRYLIRGGKDIDFQSSIRADRALIRWKAEQLAKEAVGVTKIRRAELTAGETKLRKCVRQQHAADASRFLTPSRNPIEIGRTNPPLLEDSERLIRSLKITPGTQ
jgi:hypothetical protein